VTSSTETREICTGYPFTMNATNQITMVEPLYVKHSDVMYVRGDIGRALSTAADRVVPACCEGAQKIRGVWYLFINNEEARAVLLNSLLNVNNLSLSLMNTHPYARSKFADSPTLEKIVFKDIPLNDPRGNTLIAEYLSHRPHIKVVSDVQYEQMRKEHIRDTPYKTGE